MKRRPNFITIEATNRRFFELVAWKDLKPCWIRIDSASAPGVKLVSLCVNGVEQLKQSVDAMLFNELSDVLDLNLPEMQRGQVLDMTFTGQIRKVGVFYYEASARKAAAE